MADEDLESAGPNRAGGVPAIGPSRVQSDQQSLTWSRVTLSPTSCIPPPRSGAASVVVKGRLYMFGVCKVFRGVYNIMTGVRIFVTIIHSEPISFPAN